MDDASRVPPAGSPDQPEPDPDPVVGLAETQLERLYAQLQELAETVDRLGSRARREAAHAAIGAVEHNLGEIARRLHTKDPGS